MIFQKRGLSEVVSTVLIILLTVVAVMILASFIVPWVRNSLPGSTECAKYQDYFQFYGESKYNCKIIPKSASDTDVDHPQAVDDDYKYAISVKGGNNDGDPSNIKGFQLNFMIDKEGKNLGTHSVRVIKGEPDFTVTGFKMLDNSDPTKSIYNGKIAIPDNKAMYTYTYTNKQNLSKVEIHPILNNDKICGESDVIEIPLCLSGVGF